MIFQAVLYSGIIPGGISLVLFLILQYWTEKQSSEKKPESILSSSSWISGLAIAIPFVVSWVLLHNGFASFPPLQSTNWTYFFAITLSIYCLIKFFFPSEFVVIPASRIIPLSLAVFLILQSRIMGSWALSQTVFSVGAILGGTLLLWYSTEILLKKHQPQRSLSGIFMLLSFLSSLMILTEGSFATSAQHAGAITASMGSCFLLTLFFPRKNWLDPSGIMVFYYLLFSELIGASFYAYLPVIPTIILLLLPLTAWIPFLPKIKNQSLKYREVCRYIGILIILGAAGFCIYFQRSAPSSYQNSPPSDYGSYEKYPE